MSIKLALFLAGFAGLIGIGFGYFLRFIISLGKRGSMELEIKQMTLTAKEDARRITEEADKKSAEVLGKIHSEEKEREGQWKRTEERLIKKEELLDKRQFDIDAQAEGIKRKVAEVEISREKAEELNAKKREELERVANLSREDAKKVLLEETEKQYAEDLLVRMQKLEMTNTERLDRKAKDILATSIQRLASSTASEVMITNVPIPSDDIKGKVIGKEGRNIRAFERASGVDVIIDDTPGAIIISSFDPIRRQVARVALENLILDGRIQPAKIEEHVEKAREEINKIIKKKARKRHTNAECSIWTRASYQS